MQAMLNGLSYPTDEEASVSDQQFWIAIQDSLRQNLPSYLVDAKTAAHELALHFPLSLMPRDTIQLAERMRVTRTHHLAAFCSLFPVGDGQTRVMEWSIEIFSHIHSELSLSLPWVLFDQGSLTEWLDLMRAERLSEEIRIFEPTGSVYQVTLLQYDVQHNGWRETRQAQSSAEIGRLLNEPNVFSHIRGSQEVILRRVRGPVERSQAFADDVLSHAFQTIPAPADALRDGFDAIRPLMEHAMDARNAHELLSAMVQYLPASCHLNRAAIFLYLPLLQAFKGIYAYHLDEAAVRRVIEGKTRFLELLAEGRRGASIIAATEVIAANYVDEFRLKDVLVLPLYANDDVEAILLMDRNGVPFQCSPAELRQLEVVAGWFERLLRRHMEATPHTASPSPVGLTPREVDILHLIGQGLQNKSIAQRLNLSPLTVRDHTSHIMSKLGTSNRTELVVHAYRLGLLDNTVP